MKYLKHHEIDQIKWDALLAKVPKVHFYFLFDYLTSICKWDAIVVEQNENYVLILPIPFKQKLWFKYFYQPFFCQQLGIVSLNELTSKDVINIKKILEKRFSFGLANWKSLTIINQTFTSQEKINYELDLTPEYSFLQQNYNTNRKRRLKKLTNDSYEIKTTTNTSSIEQSISRFSEIFSEIIPEIKQTHYHSLKVALEKISKVCKVYSSSVYDKDKITASALFIEFQDRIVYLLGFTENDFRSEAVQSLIFDSLIKNSASSDKILDFEGGASSGVGGFYKSFGGKILSYVEIAVNSKHLIFRKIFR